MKTLVINTGSTSVKLSAYSADACLRERRLSGKASATRALSEIASGDRFDVVAHRVVHGGPYRSVPSRIDDSVRRDIEAAVELAPLHNPSALHWIDAARALFAGVPQVAVFDTGFYRDLPEVAVHYAIPAAVAAELGIRRYGFHGIAHQAMNERWQQLRPDLYGGGRLLTFQLGGGCSATASIGGRPLDTSMGFSPAEGLMMATRSGDIDPGAVLYLARKRGGDLDAVETLLNHHSGLRGVSGSSGDMEQLLKDPGAPAAAAVNQFCYRAKKYLGAYIAVLGGVDGIVFGGGIGEHAPAVRERILEGLEVFGIHLDRPTNRDPLPDAPLAAGPVDVRVLAVEEAAVIARTAERIVAGT